MSTQFLQPPQSSLSNIPTSPKAPNHLPQLSLDPLKHIPSLIEKQSDPNERMRKALESDNRTDYEGQILFEQIKNFQFFETFNERNSNNFFEKAAFIHLCQKLKYEKVPAKKVIFKQNDPCNGKLYLIYSGEVSIVVSEKDFVTNPPVRRGDTFKLDADDIRDSKLGSRTTTKEELPVSSPPKESPSKQSPKKDVATPSINVNQVAKSRFAVLQTPKEQESKVRASESEVGSMFKNRPDTFAFKEEIKKRETPNGTRFSSYFNNQSEETQIEKDKATTASQARPRRRTFRGNNSQVEQEAAPVVVQEPIQENKEDKAKSKSLKAKFKAITHLTLGAVKFGRAGNNAAHTLTEEEIEANMSLEDLIQKYGRLENRLEKGGSFGDRALISNQPRTATVIANTDCEFLVIHKRDFHYVSENYDSRRKQTIQFLIDYIPDIENIHTYEAVERLLYALQEKTYERGTFLTNEGERGNQMFILYDGHCEITKNLRIEDAIKFEDRDNVAALKRRSTFQNQQIAICKVQKGVLLGEEVLFKENDVYSFTIKVTSAFAKVFTVTKENFFEKFPNDAQTDIQKIFMSKMFKYTSLIRDIIATKYPDMVALGNDFKVKELGLVNSSENLIIRPLAAKESPEAVPRIRHNDKRSLTFKASSPRVEKESYYSPQVSDRQKCVTSGDITQVKQAITPFMRSMLAPHAFNTPSRERDGSKNGQDSFRKINSIECNAKYNQVFNSPYRPEYLSVEKGREDSLDLITMKKQTLAGLRLNHKSESSRSFRLNARTPSSEISKRQESVEPQSRMDTSELPGDNLSEGDKKNQGTDETEDFVILSKKNNHGSTLLPKISGDARVDTLYKQAQKKINKGQKLSPKFICTVRTQTAVPAKSLTEYGSINLTTEASSKQNRTKYENPEYLIGTERTETMIVKPASPSKSTRQGYRGFYKERTETSPGFGDMILTGRSPSEGPKEEMVTRKKMSSQQQRDGKDESHEARLKKKHQIRLQLMSKRTRDALQIKTNNSGPTTMQLSSELKISSSKNGVNSFRYLGT